MFNSTCWEVDWRDQIGDRGVDQLGEDSCQGKRPFIPYHEQLVSIWFGFHERLNLSDNTRVCSTAQSSITCDWHQQCLFDCEGRFLLLQVRLVVEDLDQRPDTKALTTLESSNILFHLGCGNHLHCLGDLLDGVDGSHTQFDQLQVLGGEAEAGSEGSKHNIILQDWDMVVRCVDYINARRNKYYVYLLLTLFIELIIEFNNSHQLIMLNSFHYIKQ